MKVKMQFVGLLGKCNVKSYENHSFTISNYKMLTVLLHVISSIFYIYTNIKTLTLYQGRHVVNMFLVAQKTF